MRYDGENTMKMRRGDRYMMKREDILAKLRYPLDRMCRETNPPNIQKVTIEKRT